MGDEATGFSRRWKRGVCLHLGLYGAMEGVKLYVAVYSAIAGMVLTGL